MYHPGSGRLRRPASEAATSPTQAGSCQASLRPIGLRGRRCRAKHRRPLPDPVPPSERTAIEGRATPGENVSREPPEMIRRRSTMRLRRRPPVPVGGRRRECDHRYHRCDDPGRRADRPGRAGGPELRAVQPGHRPGGRPRRRRRDAGVPAGARLPHHDPRAVHGRSGGRRRGPRLADRRPGRGPAGRRRGRGRAAGPVRAGGLTHRQKGQSCHGRRRARRPAG